VLKGSKSAYQAYPKPIMKIIMMIAAFNNQSNELEYLKLSIKSIELGSIEFFDKLNQLLHTFFILKEKSKINHCHRIAGCW
jgi:hypothetical protein